jgi:carbon storage regulator
MLILARKQHESIEIDGGIRIIVLEICGSQVRIGIEAPRTTNIVRSEVLLRQQGNDTQKQPPAA